MYWTSVVSRTKRLGERPRHWICLPKRKPASPGRGWIASICSSRMEKRGRLPSASGPLSAPQIPIPLTQTRRDQSNSGRRRRPYSAFPGRTTGFSGFVNVLVGGAIRRSGRRLAVLTNQGDERLRGARQAAVAAIDETQLAPQINTVQGKQFHLSRLHVVTRKTLADERHSGVGSNEAFDHADARQLHRDVNARAVGAEQLVEHLPRIARLGKDERLLGNLRQGDARPPRKRIFGVNHHHQAVAKNGMDSEIRRLDGKRHDADIDRAVLQALQDLVAKVPVDTDLDKRIAALKFGKDVRQKVEARSLVGAEDDRALHPVTAVRDGLHGLVTQREQALRVFEETFSGRRKMNRLGRAVEEPWAVGLLELANLRADRRLRAENLLAGTRETAELGHLNECRELVEVHSPCFAPQISYTGAPVGHKSNRGRFAGWHRYTPRGARKGYQRLAFNSYVRAIVRGREALTVGVHGHRVADSIVEALENEAAVRVCVAVLVPPPLIPPQVKAEGAARQVAPRE